MKKLYLFPVVAGLLSCGDTTETSPSQLNLDRPVDIGFACWGGLRITHGAAATPDQQLAISAQPLASCDTRAAVRTDAVPSPRPVGQEDLEGTATLAPVSYYGFILQSSRGTVALARWEPKPASAFSGVDVSVLDADPLTPGKNGISVGEDPIAIAGDNAGCKEITANAGSCDLSVIDINSALDEDPAVDVQRVDVVTPVAGGTTMPLRARPAAMVMAPQTTVVGNECAATATGIAYIAYPACHVVAAVDLATGQTVGGIQYSDTGVATILADTATITCADECGGSGAGTPTTGPRPVALDLLVDPKTQTRRMAIGSDNFNSVTIVEIDAAGKPMSLQPIELQDTDPSPTATIGVTSVALSPQIGMGGSGGFINDDLGAAGGTAQFVYAVASDHTVRVAEILTRNKECDTQVDPRLIHDLLDVHALSCLVVGDPATPARRAGARGPGIELIGDAIPNSVAIARADALEGDGRSAGEPGKLIGYFAYVTAANGQTFVVNIDDDDFVDLIDENNPLATPLPKAIAHQLRDGIPARDDLPIENDKAICDTNGFDPDAATGAQGPTRATNNPTRAVPSSTIAGAKAITLPNIHHVKCIGADEPNGTSVSELEFAAPIEQRELAFPDLRGLRSDETWTLTWEGSLSLDGTGQSIDGPPIRESMLSVDPFGMRMTDATRPYCAAGVEPYDIVQFRGCDPAQGNSQCPVGYRCYTHPDSQIAGLGSCLLADEADRLADACKPFLTSIRRYTVKRSSSGTMVLAPRKRVLRTTPVHGCTDDAQCKTLADYTVTTADGLNPNENTDASPDPHAYSCMVDNERPVPGNNDGQPTTGKLCVMTCQADADCALGTVCENNICMEGVEPPQACINAPQRYELHAHDAFTVIGSPTNNVTGTGYQHPIIADTGGNCVVNPAASPFQIGRIPLSAPACDPTTDPITGKKADGTYDVNPCQQTITETEFQPRYVANTCAAANPSSELADREVTSIHFRNRGLAFSVIDPTYPGDLNCIGDRMGTLGPDVPQVVPNFQITFRQVSGTQALLIPIQPSYPVKVVRGPGQSIWVVDEGDFLSTSITLPSTRGKVYRVEAAILNTVNVLQ